MTITMTTTATPKTTRAQWRWTRKRQRLGKERRIGSSSLATSSFHELKFNFLVLLSKSRILGKDCQYIIFSSSAGDGCAVSLHISYTRTCTNVSHTYTHSHIDEYNLPLWIRNEYTFAVFDDDKVIKITADIPASEKGGISLNIFLC